jgi:tetratricopeptide (TPR) repeat protein
MKRSVLFILFCAKGWLALAQTSSQCMALAQEQEAIGNDRAARQLYQRVLHFDRKTYGTACYQALAPIALRLGNYEQAAFYFDLVYQNAPSDSLKNEALVQKSAAFLLQGRFPEARREILSIETKGSSFWAERKTLYTAACLYGERDFSASEKTMMTLAENDPNKRKALKKAYRKAKKINKKKPKTAKTLSMVIPGAGQLYAGDYRNALNSFGLNAVMGYWFYYTAISLSLSDAVLSTGPWLFRYYAGGFQRAPALTETVKEEKLRANFQGILEIMGK